MELARDHVQRMNLKLVSSVELSGSSTVVLIACGTSV